MVGISKADNGWTLFRPIHHAGMVPTGRRLGADQREAHIKKGRVPKDAPFFVTGTIAYRATMFSA